MKSIAQANENLDKKLKQRQYVRELEDQIKLRDRIKKDEEVKRVSQFDQQHPQSALCKEVEFDPQFEEVLSQTPVEPHTSSPKSMSQSRGRMGLGSAPKAMENVKSGETYEIDPFGGNVPVRKRVGNRIDQELESRGSIFSGRDEKSILIRKRNIQQQHMKEELLRQIEEKKTRDEQIKKKRQEEEMKEELRMKQELGQVDIEDKTARFKNPPDLQKQTQNQFL
jgi:hypothetical protein